MRLRNRRRRGAMYLAVLLTATIVAIIGISALAATRIQLRAAEGDNNVAAARFYAQSAIEMGAFAVNSLASWRTTYTHGAWISDRAIGNGTYAFKLVDEENGNLTADPLGPVRLYGRGSAGEAVRTYSVVLAPETIPQNVLSNPGFESGTTDWYILSPGSAEMGLDTSAPHSGTACVQLKNRDNRWNGPTQDITSVVKNGTPYEVDFWVNMDGYFDDVRGVFRLESTGDGVTYPQIQVTPGAGWVEITGTITPVWNGDLISAAFYIGTSSFANPFRVDDVIVKVADSAIPMVAAPGTWRREVD
jgi:hypothetical protein